MIRIKAYDLVKMALGADLYKVTDLLVAQGYLQQQKGKQDAFICPYHQEKTGSFYRNKNYSSITCFGCGAKVKPLQLYTDLLMKHFLGDKIIYLSKEDIELERNLYVWQAAIEICCKLKLINEQEKQYQETALNTARITRRCSRLYFFDVAGDIVTSKSDNQSIFVTSHLYKKEETFLEIAQSKVQEFKNIKIASREDLHFIYSLFRDAVELTRGYRLFEHHKNELLYTRRLSEYEIQRNGYFSHPTKSEKDAVMTNLLNLITRNGKSVNILKDVPGFSYNTMKMRYEIATDYDAYFIPLWDLYGNTHREQLRTNLKSKYLWFTKTGAGNCKTPTSTIFPFDRNYLDLLRGYLQPSQYLINLFTKFEQSKGIVSNFDSKNEIVVIISEGHFKTYELAKYYNCIGVSIQGLNTWSCACVALIKLQSMLQQYNKRISRAIIAFDSDTKVKRGLLDNGRNLSKVLRNEGIDTYYLTWESKLGKGFDDVLHNGYSDEVFSLAKDLEYEHLHSVITSLIALNFRKAKENLTAEEVEMYYEKLEHIPIQELEQRLKKNELINIIIYKRFGDNLFTIDQHEVLRFVQELSQKELNELNIINSQLQ